MQKVALPDVTKCSFLSQAGKNNFSFSVLISSIQSIFSEAANSGLKIHFSVGLWRVLLNEVLRQLYWSPAIKHEDVRMGRRRIFKLKFMKLRPS